MKIPLMNPICDNKMIRASVNALKTERFLKGQSVSAFQNEFADFVGTRHAMAVNNGTMGLLLSLMAIGIKKGDYVLTTPATFISTANAIIFAGAIPVFVDIDLETYNIDPVNVKEAIQKNANKIKAIIPVHLYGYPAKMDELMEIAKERDIRVIEDACQAHGAEYKGKRTGSIGDIGAFSFYPSKNMTVCGDGGMVTTSDDELADAVTSMADNGRAKGSSYMFQYLGLTARMQTTNAAIGRIQLAKLNKWNARRRKVAKRYNKLLTGVGDLKLPPSETKEVKPVYHIYGVMTSKRDALKTYLENKGIECGIHYPVPVHMQAPYKEMGFAEGMFPNTEKHAANILSIPMHQHMKDAEVDYVAESIIEFFRS